MAENTNATTNEHDTPRHVSSKGLACYIWGSAVRDESRDESRDERRDVNVVRDTNKRQDTNQRREVNKRRDTNKRRDSNQRRSTTYQTTRFGKGHVKVMDVTLEEVGVSSKMKATENIDGSYGVRRRISTHKRRSGSCRR